MTTINNGGAQILTGPEHDPARDINPESLADATDYELQAWFDGLIPVIIACNKYASHDASLHNVRYLRMVIEEKQRRRGG